MKLKIDSGSLQKGHTVGDWKKDQEQNDKVTEKK